MNRITSVVELFLSNRSNARQRRKGDVGGILRTGAGRYVGTRTALRRTVDIGSHVRSDAVYGSHARCCVVHAGAHVLRGSVDVCTCNYGSLGSGGDILQGLRDEGGEVTGEGNVRLNWVS